MYRQRFKKREKEQPPHILVTKLPQTKAEWNGNRHSTGYYVSFQFMLIKEA